MVVFDAAWQLNLLRKNLSLHANPLACRAENFRNAACSFALRAPLFNVVVANDAASATTLEALARLGTHCSSLAFALVAHDSFIEFEGHFGARNGLHKGYLNIGFVVGSPGVISCDSCLGSLPLEIEEFVELIEHLLPVLLLAALSTTFVLLPLLPGSLSPELLSLPLLSPLVTRHCSLIRAFSPIEIVIILLWITILLVITKNRAVCPFTLMRMVVSKAASFAASLRPKAVLVIVKLLLRRI